MGWIVYVASDCRIYMRSHPHIVAVDIEYEASEILLMPEETTKASDDHEVRIARWGEKSLFLINCQGSSIFKPWMMSRDRGTMTWAEVHRVSMMEIGIASPRDVHTFILIDSNTLCFFNEWLYLGIRYQRTSIEGVTRRLSIDFWLRFTVEIFYGPVKDAKFRLWSSIGNFWRGRSETIISKYKCLLKIQTVKFLCSHPKDFFVGGLLVIISFL